MASDTVVRLRKAVIKGGITFLAPAAVLFLALSLRMTNPPLMREARLRIFDSFQRLQPRIYEDAGVRIIDLDDESLERIGQWPWPRTQVATLVARLKQLGASAIVFDIVFAEPDRTSPARILPLWSQIPEVDALRAIAEKLPDHDDVLAQTIAWAGNVVTGFPLLSDANDSRPTSKAGYSYGGDDPTPYLIKFNGAVVNLEPLEAAAAGNGSFSVPAETDGIIRRVPFVFRLDDAAHPSPASEVRLNDVAYPSLVAEALRVAQGASSYIIKSSGASGEQAYGEHTGINHIKVGAFGLPTDARGRIWLYDTGFVPERYVPAWRVMDEEVDPEALAGTIVFIGTSAAGLMDIRATPLNAVAAGVEVHAQLTEQIILQNFLQRPDWATGAEVVYLFVLGVLLIALLPRLGALWCAVLGTLAGVTVFALSWYAYTTLHWLLDPVFPSIVALLIYLVASLVSFLREEAEKRQVRNAFSRYMSPELVERLARNPELLRLGGETKVMTFLFADIRGFTTISEQFDAHGLTTFINRFLTPMTDLILQESGTIDKYMGDCIMAFWNAPLDDPLHSRHACQAALQMRDYLVTWNLELQAEAEAEKKPFIPVHIGIGLNTGECCVGNMGSTQRFDYSVLGDEVNLASRLEGQSKNYGVDICVGPNTFQNVEEFAVLELDLVTVKGKTKPVHMYALLKDPEYNAKEEFQALRARHADMLVAYRAQRWDEAWKLVEECLVLDTRFTRLRTLYTLYIDRITAFRANPPGDDWDGVYVATSK